jgi:hypothetical protein
MPVRSHALKDTVGDCACGPEKGFCRSFVTLLAQQDFDEVPIAIYSAVEIGIPRVTVKKTSLGDTPLFCQRYSCPWRFSTRGHW